MESIDIKLEPTKAAHVYSAINAVSLKLAKEGISKNRKNQQQGFMFRGIDDVYNALSVPMAGAGLCILPRVLGREVTERTTAKGGVLFYVVLDMEFDFVSSVDGSKHTVRVVGEAMDSGDKATNKAMSAAFKYACMQAFCIPTEGDNDADATTHEVTPINHTKADPLGRDDLTINADHRAYADAFVRAVAAGGDSVFEVQADMDAETKDLDGRTVSWGSDDKLAVWSLLDSKTRAAIKKALAQKEAA